MPHPYFFPPNQKGTLVTYVNGVNINDKSLDLSECIFWKKIFLVNLTFAAYISSSGCTLTFGASSEGSLACSPFAVCRRGRSLR